MTKIVYFIKGDEGEIVSFTPGTAEVVEVRLEGVDEGIISFGPKSARLKGGIARIALSVLPDGDYTPRVSTSGSHIYLAEIRKTAISLPDKFISGVRLRMTTSIATGNTETADSLNL